MCTVPTGGGKDSVCTAPTREGKTQCVQSPPEGEKTLCVQDISNQVQFNSVQEKLQNLPVGGQTEAVPSRMGKSRLPPVNYRAHKRRIQVALQRTPKLIQGTLHSQQLCGLKQNALWTSIQDLLQKGAIEVVHTPDSLEFYSRLFLVPKPGNRWRPVIDLSALNKFLAIPKFKMETPESIRASLRKGEWVTSIDSLTPTYMYLFTPSLRNTSGFISKVSLTSSPAYLSG